MSRVTIRDVAELADVSVATVSAVINRNKYVSPELKRRVERAIDQLGYRRDLVARSLRIKETKTIGLIFTNITSPIWPPLVRAAQKVAQQAGFDTFLVTTDEDGEREKTSLSSLLAKQVDGILITPASSEGYEHIREASRSIPIIAIERKVPGVECVITNNGEITRQAVNHLIDHGYERIGLVTIPLLGSNIGERIEGYRRTLREHDLYDPDLVREADFVGDTAFDLALDLISIKGVDAIFTTSQSTAMGVLRAANQLGCRVPDDLALFGYDDVPWMEVVASPLSTIRQPAQEMATLATELLLERLEGREPSGAAMHMLESSLVIRCSCGCCE
ncbi:MAG: substrate-binding domain-containing protein [Anaerolineae bacterium]|nr:substrate-binding domain-containing protein [Anaerolineae bacterium]